MLRLITLLAALHIPVAALAWKPTTHAYLADLAVIDALDDGRISLPVLGSEEVRTYPVDPAALAALKKYRSAYRAGVLGPDAYPDIATGQQYTHPPKEDSAVPGGSDTWLAHVWKSFGKDARQHAFRLGYVTHAAGDMFGHSFINNFTGGPFTLNPSENAIKHVVLEGYFDKRLPAATLKGAFFDASIKGLEGQIYNVMINARPGNALDKSLLRLDGAGAKFSVPRVFSTLRAGLEKDINTFNRTVADYERRIKACKWNDWSCSAAKLRVQQGAYIAANGIQTAYKSAWRTDIDRGLKAWPGVSHEVAEALFFNAARKADIDRADAVLSAYARDHLLSMAGAPDFVGLTAKIIGKIIEAITPDFLLAPIRKLKEDMLNAMLVAAIGMDKTQLKEFLTRPDRYFDNVMTKGNGEHVTLKRFNAEYLALTDAGYTNPSEAFAVTDVPAAYNTMIMSKLILLTPATINTVLTDFGSSAQLQQPNTMLGFIRTLDGSRQWTTGMVFAADCAAYDRLFMTLPIKDGGCGP